MSESSNDATVTTATATANKNTNYNNSPSPHHMVKRSSTNASSPKGAITDKEKDLISPRKDKKLSKESKKQAMGDIRSSDDPTKSVIESTISRSASDNAKSRKSSNFLKTDTKSTENKKVQTVHPLNEKRRFGNVFYPGYGGRGFINCGSRSTIYTSRDYWRPHSTISYNGNGSRRWYPGAMSDHTKDIVTRNAPEKHSAGNGNERTAANFESSKNANFHRSQVTRTFHNGTLRANRTRRGNVSIGSRDHNSEHTSQRLIEYFISNGNSSPINEACHFSSNNAIFNQRHGKFPIIYATPTGTISVLLNKGVTVEITVDRAVRVLCYDKFSAVCNGNGNSSCLLHKKARIFQQEEKVFCNFGSNLNEKAAVFGTQGVLFTMSHLTEAYLVSSTILKGTLPISLGRLQFPSLDYDFTVHMFFTDSQNGDQFTELCNEIAQEARYGTRDGILTITMNGVYIKQNERGDVEVNCRPKHISCSPLDNIVHVRTNMVDMALQEDDKAFVKRGLKRVHVSRSGMVVSDGNCITSMDHFGHIISSA
ncbi:hypothetical protein QQG55_47070 [Brugia pahangi]|uniref:RING-type domain-containing protein n=1 Tax=Brugia pahangi TaxID=6280 RepID=A0A0N4TMM3_BRUPA|nr:unnamed protein product [Brugia pahangi]